MPRSFNHAHDQDRESYWRRHILAQRVSPLSITEYCHRHSLHSPSFFRWRKRLGLKASANSSPPTPAFVRVDLPTGASAASLTLHLPGERRLDIAAHCEALLLRTVLAVLEGRPC
jgi:hypothetical protein